MKHAGQKVKKKSRLPVYIGRFFLWVFVTLLIGVFGLYSMLFLINRGPSDHFRDLFVVSVMESSAGGILAEMFLSDEEITKIMSQNRVEESTEITDTSLINIPGNSNDISSTSAQTADSSASQDSEAEGSEFVYDDPDGDGIELHEVHGTTFSGMMMIVYDPSRVVVSAIPEFSHGYHGWTLEQHIENNGAVAGINGGKYEDTNGLGAGAWPEGIVISGGEVRCGNDGGTYGVYGFDNNNVLIVGRMTAARAMDMGIRDALTFGPALIVNGNPATLAGAGGGLNPRTAIGQRSDGAVLLLVIEGRKTSSLGASMADLIDVFLEYGAVNAANLDGGMSSSMFYNGEQIVDNCTVRDTRRIPTAFVVLPQETSDT